MLEALDRRPSLAQASDFTVTPWLVTPGVPVSCFLSGALMGLWFTVWPTEMSSESGLCLAHSYLPQGARPSGRSTDVCGMRGVVT